MLKKTVIVESKFSKTVRKPYKWAKLPRGASLGKKTGNDTKRPKKRTEADLKREWLIPQQSFHLRYKWLRGVYWYWLSRDVRKKEWEKWKVCITCLVPLETWQEGQCGHLVASSFCGEYLRFNRANLTIQHAQCNNPRFSPHAGICNAVNIDKRHGVGYMENLLSLRKKECKEPKQDEYRQLICALDSYKEALNGLSSNS